MPTPKPNKLSQVERRKRQAKHLESGVYRAGRAIHEALLERR